MSQQMMFKPTEWLMQLRRDGVAVWEENGSLRFRAPRGQLTEAHMNLFKQYKPELLKALRAENAAGQDPLAEQSGAAISKAIAPDRAARFDPFPLTDVQSAYLLGRQNLFGYGGVACHIYLEIGYPQLDGKCTEEAWNRLVLRHDMLRMTIDGSGQQRVNEDVPRLKVPYIDISSRDQVLAAGRLDELRQDMGHRMYDTAKWPLFDVCVTKTADSTIMHVSLDFLIADWTSIWLLLKEFELLYKEAEQGGSNAAPGKKEPSRGVLPELELSFRDYVLAERSLRDTPAYAADRDYWLGRVETLPAAPDLPLARQQKNEAEARFRRRLLQLEPQEWEALKGMAQRQGLTPTVLVLTAYAAVLERWGRSSSFCLNLTMLNRLPLHPDLQHIVGDFTSVNLLAVERSGNRLFIEQAKALQKRLFEDLDHRLFSGIEVMRDIARERGRDAALMPYVFTSSIGLVDAGGEGRLEGVIGGSSISQTPQVLLDCQAMDSMRGLQVNWDVREGVFPEGMIDDMFDSFAGLLRELAHEERLLHVVDAVELPRRHLEERHRTNDTRQPLPERQLHEAVLELAWRMPDRIAVIDSEAEVTYLELAERAAAVARQLKASGCAAGEHVAICMEKSVHQAAAVLGVLSAGAVYVPIDRKQPELRRRMMLEQAGIRFILADSRSSLLWPAGRSVIKADQVVPLPSMALPDLVHTGLDPDLPAYVIYTSGSTGEPKGVVVSHRAAANTILDINRRFAVNENDRVLALAQLSFDLSVYDLFGPLSVGGTLVYPPDDSLADPSQWAQCMARHGVTIWNSAPAPMQMLMDYLQSEPGLVLPDLRLALLSGDWIPLTLPDLIGRRLPSVQTVALGGATEAAIWSNCHVYQGLKPEWQSIPYGKPLANQSYRVLDKRMRDCPVWVTGELYIGGHGLAQGYLGDSEKTASRFIRLEDGQRLYRTGDLGRYMPGGELEFLGREDHQVKIRGHRIELGEIEATLLKHPAVAAAAVVADGAAEDKSLLAVIELTRMQVEDPGFRHPADDRLTTGIADLAESGDRVPDRSELEEAVNKLDEAVYASMLATLHELGLFAEDGPADLEMWLIEAEIVPAHHWLVRRWAARLTEAGLLAQHDDQRYSSAHKPELAMLTEKWQQVETAWTNKLSSADFIAYVRSCAERLPELLLGQQDPVALLFPEGKLDYVRSLYVDHFMASYLNRGISALLKRIAREHPGDMLRVLEIGAGTGATTAHALAALEGVPLEYSFTDVSSFFIPGAKARFGGRASMRFGLLDIDRDSLEQGFSPNSFDVVLAAGVLENARDIPASMNRIAELIRPGGWFVFTEPTGEHAWILASQGFMMMEPGDGLRERSSYLDRGEWLGLLEKHGDEPVLMLPEEGHPLEVLGFHLYARRFKSDRAAVSAEELNDFLAQRLPAAMLPSHLLIADSLPLTGNGKVNRRELASWRPRAAADQDIPEAQEQGEGELELQLSALWANSLGLEGIGRTQNFYKCGADSLIMAQVAGKLRDYLAASGQYADIPFDTLLRQMLNYPTIAELAVFIRESSGGRDGLPDHDRNQRGPAAGSSGQPEIGSSADKGHAGNAVLTSYGGGDTGPLRVVFHAGLGTMNCFRLLLGHMESQEAGPIIGITVADTEQFCAQEPSGLIEQIAEDYVGRLMDTGHKEMQLIGYCLGGLIAVEVARRLVERGVHIADLVLIDSHPVRIAIDDELVIESLFVPNLNISITEAGMGDLHPEELARGLLHIYEHNNRAVPEGSACRLDGDDELERTGRLFRTLSALSLRDRFTAYVDAIARTTGERMPVEMAEGLFRLYRQSFKAAQYTPPPYVGDIRFLLAKEPFSFLPGAEQMTLEFWQDICIGDLKVIDIEGNHFSCIEEEPHAAELAKIIMEPLR
ncbi:amino acid adenylation domain-containing protein [Paenibacillus sp. HN-1]|uniref:non-ribosomal peptide synthetase n=1 Tax=Paenibacillus TaxID=44249 RepID=UPI001CA99211|nr:MULTISPECIES: non-ribosomal peptide synthetase [Paenibacillus]MBY9080392.1 amino acid adenylation domain-containing protein [Paenibacillus sp. CGMCC 1.18879]MBY9083972.1 amino acid adenylation domain-containing protein [Paenibacillus sinensis]